MRVESLLRFLHGRIVASTAWFALLLFLVVISLLAFGAAGVAAGTPVVDPQHPFRW